MEKEITSETSSVHPGDSIKQIKIARYFVLKKGDKTEIISARDIHLYNQYRRQGWKHIDTR